MEKREIIINYKGYHIKHVLGSNWAYVGSHIFDSVLSAKQTITRRLNAGRPLAGGK